MPAQGERLVDFPFAAGIDQRTRAELLQPGSLLRAENVVMNKRGTFQKRPGATQLPSAVLGGTTLGACARIFALGSEAVVSDGHKAHGYSSRLGTWIPHDRLPEAVVERIPVAPIYGTSLGYDIAVTSNGYLGVMYQAAAPDGSQSIYAMVLDASTYQVMSVSHRLYGVTTATGSIRARICAVGTTLVVAAQFVDIIASSTNIDVYTFDTSIASPFTLGWSAHPALINNSHVEGSFDIQGFTSVFAVAYVDNTGAGVSVSLKTFSAACALQHSTTVAGSGPVPTNVAVFGSDADRYWVAWDNGSTVIRVTSFDPTTFLQVTGTVLTMLGGPATWLAGAVNPTKAGSAIVIASGGTTDRSLYSQQFDTVAGVITPTGLQGHRWRLRPESRPWSDGTRFYAMARYDNAGDTSQNLLFAVDLTEDIDLGSLRPVASVAPRLSAASGGLSSNCPHVANVGTKYLAVHAARKNAVASAIEIVSLDMGTYTRWEASSFADVTCVSGGVPTYYDGDRVEEINFLVAPELAVTSAAGGLTGTYQWVIVYERTDRKGNVHQSAPSAPQQLVLAGQGASLSVKTLVVTSRQDPNDTTSPTRIVPYRTKAGGSVFYRCASIVATNDPQVDSVTILDTQTDAQVAAGGQLYTQPAAALQGVVTVQPHRAAPSFSTMRTHQDRLFGVADDGSIWFSAARVLGEGPWFSDLFQFPVNGPGIPTALASQDGHLIVFRADPVIAYVDGDGPPESGVGNDFSPPRYITTDVGCINARSVVTTPAGTFFQSRRGIELLNRSMQVEPFFGYPVQDLLASYPIITSAVLIDSVGRVAFTCLATEGGAEGIWLVYDYVNGAWSSYKRVSALHPAGAVSACLVGGVYYWATAAGAVYQDNPSNFLDGGTYVTSVLETPNIHVAGLKGYQHVSEIHLYAEKLTDSDITIQVGYDNKAYDPVDVYIFTAAQIAALDRPELTCKLRKPLCQSVRVSVADSSPTGGPAVGTGQGPVWIGLALSVGLEQGAMRRTPAASQ